MQFSLVSCHIYHSHVQIFSLAPYFQTSSICVLPLTWQNKFQANEKYRASLNFYFNLYVLGSRREVISILKIKTYFLPHSE